MRNSNKKKKDMEKFTPKKKSSFEDKIRNYLLEGYIIRYDMRDETPLEVMGREHLERLARMHNIGQEQGVIDEIFCAHSVLYKVKKKLEADYSVREVSCGYSGCCQYNTLGVFLDGE